jgi:tetratricopeptide (TPR) repeat protein
MDRLSAAADRRRQIRGGGSDLISVKRLYINHAAGLDWLIALEFGRVDDGQPPENWRGVSDQFAFLHDGPDGPVVGFKIVGAWEFDPHSPEVSEIWEPPLFDAPLLGLIGVPAAEVALEARSFFGGRNTLNRLHFNAAIEKKDPSEALPHWYSCLASGDSMAHFGLGNTLYDLGSYEEAYRHLRYYAEIAPHGAWNQCWYGKAAEAIGELDEARAAYQRALELEPEVGEETEAEEWLRALDAENARRADESRS